MQIKEDKEKNFIFICIKKDFKYETDGLHCVDENIKK